MRYSLAHLSLKARATGSTQHARLSNTHVSYNVNVNAAQVAVTEARTKIADPSFQAAIEKYLEKTVCKEAGDYEELCKDSIQQYAPLAFAMALQYLSPAYVCVSLTHVCPKPTAEALGAVAR